MVCPGAKGGGETDTHRERAGGADVLESCSHVRYGDGFGAVPVQESMAGG